MFPLPSVPFHAPPLAECPSLIRCRGPFRLPCAVMHPVCCCSCSVFYPTLAGGCMDPVGVGASPSPLHCLPRLPSPWYLIMVYRSFVPEMYPPFKSRQYFTPNMLRHISSRRQKRNTLFKIRQYFPPNKIRHISSKKKKKNLHWILSFFPSRVTYSLAVIYMSFVVFLVCFSLSSLVSSCRLLFSFR